MLWIDQRKFEGLKLKQCIDWSSYLSLLSVKKVRLITNFSPVSVGFFCQTKILVLFQFNERIHLQKETKRAALLGSFTTWTAKKKEKRISRKRERYFKSNGHYRFRERYKRRPQLPFYRLLHKINDEEEVICTKAKTRFPHDLWMLALLIIVSFATVIQVVTQCSSPTNGCSLELCIPFPLSRRTNNMHVTVSSCTNHISLYICRQRSRFPRYGSLLLIGQFKERNAELAWAAVGWGRNVTWRP